MTKIDSVECTLHPVGNGVFVQMDPYESMSKGGIVLATDEQQSDKTSCEGIVLAIGPGLGEYQDNEELSVGDRVLTIPGQGIRVEHSEIKRLKYFSRQQILSALK